jgi:hypothetical protein
VAPLLLLTAAAAIAFDDPEMLLDRVRRRALDGLATIPNYVCIDSIERSWRRPEDTAFRTLDRIRLELAHLDGGDHFSRLGDPSFRLTDPSAIAGHGAAFRGDFGDNRALVFRNPATTIRYAGDETIEGRPASRFEYELPLGHGGLTMAVGRATGIAGAKGTFWADRETLDVLRIDIEAYAIPADVPVRSAVTRTRYWRAAIGGHRVLLARDSEFQLSLADGIVKRNVSAFSNCREYQAQSVVSFEGGTRAEMERPPAIESGSLPAGLEFAIVLDGAVNLETAAIGDLVRAHVLEGAGPIPKGAAVTGRVERVIRRHRGAAEALIGLSFSDIQFRRTRLPFTARLVDAGAGEVRSFGYFGDDDLVRYDLPGTAHLYIADESRGLRRGFVLRWVATAPNSR